MTGDAMTGLIGLARHVPVGLLAISCEILVTTCGVSERSRPARAAPQAGRLRTGRALAAPNLRGYSNALRPTEPAPSIPRGSTTCLGLIDVAQRVNPETRIAWERARQAAIGVGLVESEYFPMLTLAAFGGYTELCRCRPRKTSSLEGFFRIDIGATGAEPRPQVAAARLRAARGDHGRREGAAARREPRVQPQHQGLAFRVQRAFYALTSIRARIAVAQSALDAARAVQGAAESRFKQGLETVPEVLLARQQAVQAEFELEDVAAKERDAQVALAESMGILPTTPLQVVDFSALALPPPLEDSVERTIDRALEQRPDLIAKVALVREKEAAVRRARADYFPTLSVVGDVGGELARGAGSSRERPNSTPTGSTSASRPTERDCVSNGSSSRAGRVSARWSSPRQSGAPPSRRSRRRAIGRSTRSGKRTPMCGSASGDSTWPSALVKASESSYEAILDRTVWDSGPSSIFSPRGGSSAARASRRWTRSSSSSMRR